MLRRGDRERSGPMRRPPQAARRPSCPRVLSTRRDGQERRSRAATVRPKIVDARIAGPRERLSALELAFPEFSALRVEQLTNGHALSQGIARRDVNPGRRQARLEGGRILACENGRPDDGSAHAPRALDNVHPVTRRLERRWRRRQSQQARSPPKTRRAASQPRAVRKEKPGTIGSPLISPCRALSSALRDTRRIREGTGHRSCDCAGTWQYSSHGAVDRDLYTTEISDDVARLEADLVGGRVLPSPRTPRSRRSSRR